MNAARSWLCFENIDDGDDKVVITNGYNLACDATEWEGRGDEKEEDVEVSHTGVSVMCAKNTGTGYVRREGNGEGDAGSGRASSCDDGKGFHRLRSLYVS